MNDVNMPYWARYNKEIERKDRAAKRATDGRKTAKREKYIKPDCVKEFENEYNAHKYDAHPDFPEYAKVRTTFRDNTANGLAQLIEMHALWHGYFVGRVNTTGIYDARRGRWRTSGSRKGMADLSAVVDGTPVQIEIKAGKDRPREDQLQTAADYERAGGRYVFVHCFADWLQVLSEIRKTPGEGEKKPES